MHNSCLTYLIKYYDEERIHAGKDPIPHNVVWTDNCPTQYKCRQNFVNVAHASSFHNNKCTITHKFAQKYRFKGSWDATGKLIKKRILNNEFKFDRCADAFDCYKKLSRNQFQYGLAKDGSELKYEKLKEYEEQGDARVLKNTGLTTRRTMIGLAVETQDLYNDLIISNDHIVLTNRTLIPDMIPIKNTLKISQVAGSLNPHADGVWDLSTAYLPCSCPPCRRKIVVQKECLYYTQRNIGQHKAVQICEKIGDKYGVSKMTVKELKQELSARQISTVGLKAVLVLRLVALLESEDSEIINNDVDTDDNNLQECGSVI